MQCAIGEGIKSNFQEIKAGIPQGPFLLLLYDNDIVKDIESEILLFAEDTCCFVTGRDPAVKTIFLYQGPWLFSCILTSIVFIFTFNTEIVKWEAFL